jgi:serine/threonine-protein kinase
MPTAVEPTRDELIGRLVLGRYRIIQQLARGGMGVVYLGRLEGAAGFARPVVIKRIHPDLNWDDTISKLFVREARILSNLQHPSIVSVVDFAKEQNDYMMILEYVHGFNVAQWERYLENEGRKMNVQHAMLIAIRVLDALHYAHTLTRPDGSQLRVVHRDVSPSNVLLDEQGQIKLHDFGIALADESDELKTQGSSFKGKLTYSAPEIFSGMAASAVSDVYSAGVVLYQLISGTNPFRRKEPGETIQRVLNYDPPPLSAVREDVPDGLDEAVARAMAKNPEARYRTAGEFCNALRELAAPEAQTTASLVATLRNDFEGIPAVMNVMSLDERDAAWRSSLEPTQRGRLPLSSWPPALEATIKEDFSPRARPQADSAEITEAAPPLKAASERPVWPIALGAAAIAAVVVAGAMVFVTRREPASPPRYLVVEKQGSADPAEPDATGSAPLADPGDTSAAQPSTAPATTSTTDTTAPDVHGPSSGPAAPNPAALSQTFRRREPAIQRCFDAHADQIHGGPQIAVKLQVGTTGKVKSADLVPATLSATALGQCLLGVARSVNFGPLQRDVGFSIPITARRVQ